MLITGEYFAGRSVNGPRHVTRSDLNMLVAARGRERSADEYRDWIRDFGFELEHVRWTEDSRGFLIARKI